MLLALVFILLWFGGAQFARAQFDFVTIGHTNNSPTSMNAWATTVALSGNYAYLANHSDGLRIYDVSDPANPRNVGHISAGGYADGVVVIGNHAYLSGNGLGLKVYNISDPANPINVGHTNIVTDSFAGIAGVSNYVCLAYNYAGLYVCDISNPTNPVVVAHTNNNLPYTYGLSKLV
jgi:hypothetical protein